MFQYKKTNSKQLNNPLKTLAKICPFNDADDFSKDDFKLEDDEKNTGWFFECRMCKGAHCTGYLKK